MNIFDDDYNSLRDIYNNMYSKDELNELIEDFVNFLASDYDDSTPPSLRMWVGYNDSEEDKKFNKQYKWLEERNPDSPEGVMVLWEWWVKKMAVDTNQHHLVNYIDKVQPCEYDDGIWGVEPKEV